MRIDGPQITGSFSIGNTTFPDVSTLATTGSNTFVGNQVISGSIVSTQTTLISGSSQVLSGTGIFSGSAQLPSGIISGSSQLPTGIVSSSAQVIAYGVSTTGSNILQGNQIITGSLFISENLVVAGSSSIQHISSSVVNINDNIITVNALNPSVRFGGLAVIDSGSSPQVSGSMLFDSINNQWLFVHQNQGTVTSSVLLMGPETYNSLGNESYITTNRLVKSTGIEHLSDSNITDTGTKVSINSNTEVTGSLIGTSTAVFGSSVTATSFEVGNGQYFKARRSSSNLLIDLLGIESGTDNTRLLITGDLNIKNGSLSTLLNMTTTGVATFTGSLTANSLLVERSASRNMLGISTVSLPTSGDEEGVAVIKTNSTLWQLSTVGYAADSKGVRFYNNGGTGYTAFEVAQAGGTRFIVNGVGNVGVGTTSPSAQLNVGHESHGIGIAYMGGSALPAIGGLFTDTSSGQQGYGSLLVKSRSDYAGYSINFFTAASPNTPLERMRITSGGSLVTNTNSDLNGGLIAQGVEYSIKIVGSLTGYVQGGLAISSGTDSAPSARGQGIFYFNEGNDVTWYNGSLYNSSDRFDICRKSSTSALDSSVAQTTHSLFNLNSSGAAYNATGTWGTISSDQRLKENIIDATPKLNDVLSLQVRNFNYIGKEEKYIGFIAQELEEVFPSLVTTNDMREFDRNGNVVSGLEDTKGVKVGMDFAILVKAIQEQQTIIEDLKSRLETLENN